MNDLFGCTRDVVKERYALRTPAGFVGSNLPGWSHARCIVQISAAMGAGFCQCLITLEKAGEGRGHTGASNYFVYVLAGKCRATVAEKTSALTTGGYVYIPAESDFHFHASAAGTQLLIFIKQFQPLAGVEKPGVLIGQEKDVIGAPFLGDENARLQTLLPDDPRFDLAVNIFTYQPGAALPFVECHIMEHGLVMLKGQGIYRLDADWHPVQAGDAIWMAPYCPQWFVAMGSSPASYIYYKDVNRHPTL
jgi:(S)-ureidoglycine aminohydrolase